MGSNHTTPQGTDGMPSQPPPPIKGGGNGVYIGMAVVLLLGIAVIVGVKLLAKDEVPKPVAPSPSVVASASSPPVDDKMDDIPPPPPPEAVSAAAAAAARAAAASTGAVNYGVHPDCTSHKHCGGSTSDELETALAVRARQARRCYEMALKDDSELKGKISLTVKIASNGSVCSTSVTQNELPNIAGCVENVFRRTSGTFPNPKNGCVEVNVPMSFVPGGR